MVNMTKLTVVALQNRDVMVFSFSRKYRRQQERRGLVYLPAKSAAHSPCHAVGETKESFASRWVMHSGPIGRTESRGEGRKAMLMGQ